MVITESSIRDALRAVMDPEIPTCSIVELGLVERIAITGDAVEVDLLPTFAGCPALDAIREDVARAVAVVAPGKIPRVRFVMSPPWTTDRITDEARAHLGDYGIAPPLLQIGRAPITCPYCGSDRTEEQSAFGPTPCRAIRYCPACRNPFESFKPKLRPS